MAATEQAPSESNSGCNLGVLASAVPIVIYLCLITFAQMPHWPAVLIAVLWIPILGVALLALAIPAAILLLPVAIPFIVIDARKKKKFSAGIHLPDYLSEKIESCIKDDKKLFGAIDPETLVAAPIEDLDPQDIRQIYGNSKTHIKKDSGSWKKLHTTLQKWFFVEFRGENANSSPPRGGARRAEGWFIPFTLHCERKL